MPNDDKPEIPAHRPRTAEEFYLLAITTHTETVADQSKSTKRYTLVVTICTVIITILTIVNVALVGISLWLASTP